MHTLFATPLRIILLKTGVTNAVVYVVLELGIGFLGIDCSCEDYEKDKEVGAFFYTQMSLQKNNNKGVP